MEGSLEGGPFCFWGDRLGNTSVIELHHDTFTEVIILLKYEKKRGVRDDWVQKQCFEARILVWFVQPI